MDSSFIRNVSHDRGNLAILIHDFEAWLDAVWCALLQCNKIWLKNDLIQQNGDV